MKKVLIFSLLLNFIFLTAGLAMVYRAGGFRFLLYKVRNAGKNKEYPSRMGIFESMPTLKGKIVFIGNSITAGGEWSELLERGDVANRGINGDVVQGVLSRIDPIIQDKPSKIFLMIGINDLLQGREKEAILENYSKLLEKLKKAEGTEVYVQSILPVNNNVVYQKGIDNDDIREVNARIQALCRQYELNYIDLFPLFLDPETGLLHEAYTTDGLHLSGRGYQVWKEALSGQQDSGRQESGQQNSKL